MATVTQTCKVLGSISGIPYKTVRYFARRLGQADLLPRGPRGINAPHFSNRDIATLLISILAATDGTFGVGSQLADIVQRAGNLAINKDIHSIAQKGNDHKKPLVLSGTFLNAIIRLLDHVSEYSSESILFDELGLTYKGDQVFGWIRQYNPYSKEFQIDYFTVDGEGPKVVVGPLRSIPGIRQEKIVDFADLSAIIKDIDKFNQ